MPSNVVCDAGARDSGEAMRDGSRSKVSAPSRLGKLDVASHLDVPAFVRVLRIWADVERLAQRCVDGGADVVTVAAQPMSASGYPEKGGLDRCIG